MKDLEKFFSSIFEKAIKKLIDNEQGGAGVSDHSSVARRFIIFGGEFYYARGGFNDFISSHDTLDDAVQEAVRSEKEGPLYSRIDWWHVWDCATNSIVAKSEHQAHGANDDGPRFFDR